MSTTVNNTRIMALEQECCDVGCFSRFGPLTNIVPAYINDLLENETSQVELFADDNTVYFLSPSKCIP